MENVVHELDAIIGKPRKETEKYFGRPDYIVNSFTVYQKGDKLLMLLSGRGEDKTDNGEVIKGYLLALENGEVCVSEQVHLFNEQEVAEIKSAKNVDDLAKSGIHAHGDIGTGVLQLAYLTTLGTVVILRIFGGDIVRTREEPIWKVFGSE